MPRVNQNQPKVATTIQEGKLFRERLRDRYQPTQYVRVINIDDEPLTWQYFPSTGETTEFTDNGAVRVISGRARFSSDYSKVLPGNEEMWEIKPGESEVLIGENADLFIEALYKRLVAKQRVAEKPDLEPTKARSFNWNDGLLQERMIDKIFLGVEQPRFEEKVNESPPASPAREAK